MCFLFACLLSKTEGVSWWVSFLDCCSALSVKIYGFKFIPDAGLWMISFLQKIKTNRNTERPSICSCLLTAVHSSLTVFVLVTSCKCSVLFICSVPAVFGTQRPVCFCMCSAQDVDTLTYFHQAEWLCAFFTGLFVEIWQHFSEARQLRDHLPGAHCHSLKLFNQMMFSPIK